MDQFRAPAHVLPHYPAAVKSDCFLRAFLQFARERLQATEKQIACLLSICSDDLNSDSLPEQGLIGPFVLGGLDGFPFGGKTGLGAFSHHIPERGVALLFFGPHIGITTEGLVGKVRRQGQSHPSDCCGAARKALAALESGKICPRAVQDYDFDDFQQETLEQIVLRSENEILAAGPPGDPRRFLTLTEVIYRATREQMLKLLRATEFPEPAFAFGGILINEDGGQRSDIEFRDAYYITGRQIQSITEEFNRNAEARFRAL